MAIPADPIQFWAAVGAIGALVAAVGTVVAIAIAFVQIFAEQSARRADRRLEQARKVSAWVGGTSPAPISEPPPGGTTDETQMTVTVLNASDTPISLPSLCVTAFQRAAADLLGFAGRDFQRRVPGRCPDRRQLPADALAIKPQIRAN